MTSWGYTLSSEEFGPIELVEQGRQAEAAGFDFVTVSDHFHPWLSTQGQSPFVWTTIGAVGATTQRVGIGSGVTCPIVRYHPAIVAQAAATAACLTGGRFFLGLGSGEALNEHITGVKWPVADVRQDMVVEAISIIRALWAGDTIDHHGRYFTVENAKLFTTPPSDIPIIVAASGTAAAELAANHGDGLWSTAPNAELVDVYRKAGGRGPTYGQITVCVAETRERAIDTAMNVWPNAGVAGQLTQDLPTWTHFEQAAQMVTADVLTDRIPCGPDAGPVVELVEEYADAGFDRIHFHQVGPDQQAFLGLWTSTLRDALTDTASAAGRA